MLQLNFSITELVNSETAIKRNINNMPDIRSLECLLDLIFYCLQPLRDYIKKPIIITSGYRNKEVNRLVGGVQDSQHTKGQAADFIIKGLTVQQIIELVKKSGVEYDQLINEYNKWVHISYVHGKNRKQTLTFHY